jgi:predicted dehydrogenase
MAEQLRVAVAGVGFIGPVHVRSARLANARIVGISGGDPARTRAAAQALHVDRVFDSSEALATDPDVDVVHICTPNHLHAPLARLALEAGKHVVCEKPLATTAAEAAEVTAVAARSGKVAAVPFVYRFHPVVREARARIARGDSGAVHLIHGSYLQDWLASPEDYNWRVDAALGGSSRAFADIGSHWCDLVEFVTGHRIRRLSARTITAFPERLVSNVKAFERAVGERKRVSVEGEDAAAMVFETDGGAVGTLVISQVSYGRKNRLWFEIDATREALSFDQERPDELWIGGREAQRTVVRDPGTLSPEAARYAVLPPGHVQGYADAFDGFVADAHAVMRGEARDGLPTFADGLRAARITEAVLASSRDDSWQDVPL